MGTPCTHPSRLRQCDHKPAMRRSRSFLFPVTLQNDYVRCGPTNDGYQTLIALDCCARKELDCTCLFCSYAVTSVSGVFFFFFLSDYLIKAGSIPSNIRIISCRHSFISANIPSRTTRPTRSLCKRSVSGPRSTLQVGRSCCRWPWRVVTVFTRLCPGHGAGRSVAA